MAWPLVVVSSVLYRSPYCPLRLGCVASWRRLRCVTLSSTPQLACGCATCLASLRAELQERDSRSTTRFYQALRKPGAWCTPCVSPPQANRSHHRKHAGGTGKSFCRSRGASAANASLRQQLLLVPRGAQNLRGPRRELCARSLIYETHVKHEIPVYCLPAHPPIYGLAKAELHSGHYTIPQWTLWFLLPPRQGACAPNMSNDKSYSFHSCCRQTPYFTCILLKGYVSWIATWAASRRRRSVHWMRWVSRWRRSIVEELFGELKTRYMDPGPT